ncbi:MAG: tetratricopeptide repeat protein [Acidobacteria bacterium]|nr:tetratricopeptide repeat protein [Acidobacteriota bacterium]
MRFSTSSRAALAAALLLPLALASGGCVSADKKIRAAKRSDSHIALAQKLMGDNRLPEALNQADLAIQEAKKNPEAWMTRGEVEFMRSEYDKAIEDFTAAIDRRPQFTEARSWRAWAYVEKGNFPAAEADYREGLTDRTYFTPEKLHMNLGLLLLRMGRESEGLAELKESVASNPAYSRGNYELGKVLERNGDLRGALAAYESALGGMKDSADLNLRFAIALERNGDGGRAREHFKRVIELSPNGPEAPTARDHLKRLEASS